jgi:hyperosmotically inducible periplasmic protein
MDNRRLSILLLCLAGACAHGKGSSEEARRSEEPKVARSDRDGDRARDRDQMVDAGEADEERVEVPDSRKGRGRMASAGQEVPAEEQPNEAAPGSAAAYGTSADNTRVNERDRESSALTPMDQSEAEDDRELTQRIRKAVVGEDSLSFSAKNVKIITRDGQVTLRGSVKSDAERTTIERLAKEAAGPGRVVNQLEVAD